MNVLEDTIIAISTPPGRGGLGVVRLTGPESLEIAQRLFKPKKAKKIGDFPGRLILGNIFDFEKDRPLDEAFLSYFPLPNSYTREEMVELSMHGSPVILEEVVRLGRRAGARHAEPGEFTLRAFLNGRLDIIQAEAVNDLIMASSLDQALISFRQIGGSLSRRIAAVRTRIVGILAEIEASIEFPDEGLPVSAARTSASLESLIKDLGDLVGSYETGKSLAEGITVAIAGRANVGKSTIFNALLGKERAIVTPFPGTTRDYLEERLRIGRSIFNLVDMAGLEKPSHPVEKVGIKKGNKLAAAADGLLLVFDLSREVGAEDRGLLRKFKGKRIVIVFNKMDLPSRMNRESLLKAREDIPWLEISALKGTNIDKLKNLIVSGFVPSQRKGEETILHLRQKLLLEEIQEYLAKGLEQIKAGYPEDVYVEAIRDSLPAIGRLVGEIRSDDIICDIFSRFCVGK